MRVTLSEFLEAMNRAREEERARASTILAERDQDLIQKLGQIREEVSSLPDGEHARILKILSELDPRPSISSGAYRVRFPTMFKGGPT